MAPGGRRVAVAAVTVAVVLPAVIPGLSDPVLNGLRNSDDGAGRTIRRINPILDLRDDLVSTSRAPLITYTTSVRQPEPLRIVTADVFNGQVWAPGARSVDSDNRATQLMPSPPGLSQAVKTRSAQTRIRIGPLRESYLPLPYPTSQVEAPGRWLYDPITLNVIGDGITTENLSYAVQHVEVTPTAEQLNEAGPAPAATSDYLLLPDGLPPSIRQTAVEVAGIGNDYQQAIRLQRWFREDGEFSYSTDAPRARSSASGAEAMAAFLKERRGYCVHFASTMAVMARMLGIPARVGVGFLPGEVQSNGSRVITGQDAHAWPELFFAGVGWVRFEPTPRGGDALPPDWAVPPAGVMPEDGPTSTAETETRSASPSAAATANRPVEESASNSPTGAGSGTGVPWRVVLPALLLLVLLVLLATPALGARVRTRRRWHRARDDPARAEAGWQELREGLGRLGVGWARSWTPRAVRNRLAADYRLPEPAVAAMGRLVEDVELACYAPPGAGAGRAVDARRADVRAVVSAVAATRAPAVRRRARWFPTRRAEEPIAERAPVRRTGERISRR
jgi:transglutaminase-like putative cysteine protease